MNRHFKKSLISLLLTALMLISAVFCSLPVSADNYTPDSLIFDFSTPNALSLFYTPHNIICEYNKDERSIMLATNGQEDPYVYFNLGGISADEYKYITVTYRFPVSNSGKSGNAKLYFLANGAGASENLTHFIFPKTSYTYQTVIIDLSFLTAWNGRADKIRIDPFENGSASPWDTMYIHSIAIYKTHSGSLTNIDTLNAMADGDVSGIDNFEQKATNTEYDTEVYTTPIWDGNVVYHESFLPLLNLDGTMSPISMVYDIDRVISVRNSYQDTEYKYGRDYVVENGKLILKTKKEGGQIETVPYDFFCNVNRLTEDYFYSSSFYGWLFCKDCVFYQKAQIAVTYTHKDTYSLFRPSGKAETLNRAAEKLKNKEAMNIVFCGDSITFGCNCSSYIGIPPYCPRWSQLTVDGLAERFGNDKLTHINTAIVGKESDWGFANAYENVIQYDPDLAVIALGCNDASWAVSPQVYAANMRGAVERIKNACPDCDIILVASIILNPELQPDRVPYFLQYQDALHDIANSTDHVAVVDITSMHRSLLTKKRYVDITENNVNHINDYMSRIYSQSVIAALTENETPDTAPTQTVVSADRICASNNATLLTPNGGNDPKGTYIGNISEKGVYAYGWLASSKRIEAFGYRYGDKVIINSEKAVTDFAVTNAGLSIAGVAGSTNRFGIYIPIDPLKTEVTAVARLTDGTVVDVWKITYNANTQIYPEIKYIVSADEIFAQDGVTDLAEIGANDPENTVINADGQYSVIAHGWFACSRKTVKFGYRYGDRIVLLSPPKPAETPVINAGAEYAGTTGSTNRFRISIPLDTSENEVFAIAQLEDGTIVDIWKIIYNTPAPASGVSVNNYTLTVNDAADINAIRIAPGDLTTSGEIKNAPGCINISKNVIDANIDENGNYSYELPDGGIWSVWYKRVDGNQFVVSGIDATIMTQTVDTYGVTITVNNLYGVKDFFVAKGHFDTYREVKNADGSFGITSAKFGSAHSYKYGAAVGEPGEYTICIRYNDPSRADTVMYFNCDVEVPTVDKFGKNITIGNISDIRVIRVAPGTYSTSNAVKNADKCRNFTAGTIEKLGFTDTFTINNAVDQNGADTCYTVSIEYKNLYTEIHNVTLNKLMPEYAISGNTITLSGLEELDILRYAPGAFKTSNAIKIAPGSKYIKGAAVTNDIVTLTGLNGVYSFLVQYTENSQNIFTLNID